MSDLRDAFKKAGLIDDKTDRRLKHQERVERKELGREGLDAERQRDELARRQREDEKRAETKAAQQRHDAERQRHERSKQLLARVESDAVRLGGGPRRFHYRTPDGWLPFIQIGDEAGRRLEAGELALVQLAADADPVLVPRPLAAELRQARPELVLHISGA